MDQPAKSNRFSLTRSHKSTEDKVEKARRDSLIKGDSKANPNAAINEAQPQVRNVLEESTLQPLRNVQHKDRYGNVIAEPDLCNPTRSRWERPLDTIRSFEKAIDGDYRQRTMTRSQTDYDANNQFASRRSSYFGGESARKSSRVSPVTNGPAGYDSGPSPSRFSQYGGRRPDSYYDHNGTPTRQRHGGRSQSDFGYGAPRNNHHGAAGYNQHGYHQSHDTVNTGVSNGSDSTGQWHNSTDPSSESSSLDRAYGTTKPAQPQEQINNYGMDGFGSDAIQEEHIGVDDFGMPQQAPPSGRRFNGGPPPAPSHSAPRKTIQLGGSPSGPDPYANQGGQLPSTARVQPQEEKRKSWLKRRLSKRG